jgi:hypothetical protein
VCETERDAGRCPAGAAAVAFESLQVDLTSEGTDEGIPEFRG